VGAVSGEEEEAEPDEPFRLIKFGHHGPAKALVDVELYPITTHGVLSNKKERAGRDGKEEGKPAPTLGCHS
jgi:carbonic anhydrase